MTMTKLYFTGSAAIYKYKIPRSYAGPIKLIEDVPINAPNARGHRLVFVARLGHLSHPVM
jgi:hypothetical protein